LVRGKLAAVRAGTLALALLAVLPAAASAHASLEATQPTRGEQVQRPPERVTLRFDEPVEIAFGSLRVYDAAGDRVDRGSAEHPDGASDQVTVRVQDSLQDGVYTATYRVISADSHPVSGGFTFTVGSGGAAPRLGVDELIPTASAGPVTEAGFGVVRALSYLSIALVAGGIAFGLAVWAPSLREATGAEPSWQGASEAFASRWRALALGAAVVGVVTAALGIVLQGATASGESFWSALDPTVVRDILGTRFGTVWGLRLLAFAALALLLAMPVARLAPRLQPAALGAAGLAPQGVRSLAVSAALALAVFLCATPALAGHASTYGSPWLLVPANLLHVGSMATWVGGVAMLALALPAATRRLEPAERTRLLAPAVARFSTLALLAVAALLASGVLQAVVELDAVADLWDSAFGRAILVKSGLVVGLLAIGAWNRTRARPRLARQAAAGATPGATGVGLRRALFGELGLMAGVLAATAALAAYAPPGEAAGPFSTSMELGPARAELTVDPARAGSNEIHLYLFDARTGAQYDRPKDVTLALRLPAKEIGPLDPRVDKAGPGHWVARHALISPAGDWELQVRALVSDFREDRGRVEVPVE
jgi:copper transport protein